MYGITVIDGLGSVRQMTLPCLEDVVRWMEDNREDWVYVAVDNLSM